MQEGSHQAQSNLKFLTVLKDPCHELAEAMPKDIPPMLPKLLNTIRMIWVNSEFYKSRERLTGILRKVSWYFNIFLLVEQLKLMAKNIASHNQNDLESR